ncbi:dynamin-1-like protein isoform X2 [Thrips palmi]|uniref:Dynamin-1-like protein isoform X2 n=1 Tax=Thrips palmi TaxID=161013 RepID=A0A6P9ALM7_THRPL|nr:dynamin-1-like protein isoform X2 [Thrips palmi]
MVNTMETLITKFNAIQDQFRLLREDPIELPQIVVVGIQSAGKSSVLEAIVQQSFLPRGTGIVTRCPLILQLIHCPVGDALRTTKGTTGVEEWGEFLHAGGRIFKMDEIRHEIEKETIKLAGVKKNISHDKITLKVFSPKVPNLTLVDLPGITKVPVEGQPQDIENQICDLVCSYIDNPLSIILAVVPANMDMAANEGLKLAKEADPDGTRTLAVVTKLDLMDQGTDAYDVLSGKVIPVKLGIIGVVNRSQQAIMDKKSIDDMLRDEREFLKKKYPSLIGCNGTPHLTKTLSELLLAHIKSCLPRVKARVQTEISTCENIIEACGANVEDKKKYLSRVLSDFCNEFSKVLEGGQPAFQSSKLLIGGAKICYLFDRLQKRFTAVQPCDLYCLERVTMMIRNASGPRPPFLVSEQVLEDLVKPLIADFREPSLSCVKAVMNELRNVFAEKFPRDAGLRFPLIKDKVGEILENTMNEYSKAALHMVNATIDIELAHITYGQFEDLVEKELHNIFAAESKEGAKSNTISTPPPPKKKLSGSNSAVSNFQFSSPPLFGTSFPTSAAEPLVSALPAVPAISFGESPSPVNLGIISNFALPFKRDPDFVVSLKKKLKVAEWEENEPIRSEKQLQEILKLNPNDEKHMIILGEMLNHYYKMVSNKVADSVAKTVMHFLVHEVKRYLHSELTEGMFPKSVMDTLFEEDREVEKRRQDSLDKLEVLKRVSRVLQSV